jgi:hypothetical protein
MRSPRFTFAHPVYCAGVDTWYVRFGSQHGIDCMHKARNEDDAKISAKLINQSLMRDLLKAGWRKSK